MVILKSSGAFGLASIIGLLKEKEGNSLVVQWLGLCALTAEGPVSIPGQGTKILQAVWCSQKKKERKKKKEKENMFSNGFK